MMKFVLLALAVTSLEAQITWNPASKIWFLNTATSSCVLGINERNELQTLYWGGPITRGADFTTAHSGRERSSFDPSETSTREEYPGWGGTRFFEPALKVTRADGDRDLVLKYRDHQLTGETLDITLRDIKDEISVTLHYRVFPALGVIEKHSTIRNGTAAKITLESAQSGVWSLPPGEGYRLTYVSGRWAAEDQIQREPIDTGMKILESRRGNTSHNNNP
jgi:alpha-galactosidase